MFISEEDNAAHWRDHLCRELPDLDFHVWPDETIDPTEIDYVLAWKPAPGIIKRFPNLKAILSLGAGIDGITCDPELPVDVPLVRLVDTSLAEGMTQFVLYWVLYFQRDMAKYQAFQKTKTWQQLPQTAASERRVGILGLGALGATVGQALTALNFKVRGWSRTKKTVAGVESFCGDGELKAFLSETDILVCLLPLTESTRGIIDAGLIADMPKGSILINCGRGPHVVDQDLLAALDDGHLSAAVLDVFHTEPLPRDHPYWEHPKVMVTPHIAALTLPQSGALYVAENIRRMERGEAPHNLIDLDKGY